MQRSAHNVAKRRGLGETSSQSHTRSHQLIRAWIRLWLPILVLAIVLGGFAPYACGAPTGSVKVTADVRPVFRLSVDDGVVAVSSNTTWTAAFWQRGSLVTLFGAPTAHDHVGRGGETACMTVIADDLPAR